MRFGIRTCELHATRSLVFAESSASFAVYPARSPHGARAGAENERGPPDPGRVSDGPATANPCKNFRDTFLSDQRPKKPLGHHYEDGASVALNEFRGAHKQDSSRSDGSVSGPRAQALARSPLRLLVKVRPHPSNLQWIRVGCAECAGDVGSGTELTGSRFLSDGRSGRGRESRPRAQERQG
jgi:hypothetical protein